VTIIELQGLIGARPDGVWGEKSKAALLAAFANRNAPAITAADIAATAKRLGCPRQLDAVRAVESAGRGFDTDGRPKRLFERHKFHRFTGGRFSPSAFSQSAAGGYSLDADGNGINDNWDKLSAAIATGEVDAAFMATSWGAFQIMGEWWDALGYASPFAMALACVASEAGPPRHARPLYRAFPAQARAGRAHQQPGDMPRLCRRLQRAGLPREPL
jgi:hypothetical protein